MLQIEPTLPAFETAPVGQNYQKVGNLKEMGYQASINGE
jgi:hypothetical protein